MFPLQVLIVISYRENICAGRVKCPQIRQGQRITRCRLSQEWGGGEAPWPTGGREGRSCGMEKVSWTKLQNHLVETKAESTMQSCTHFLFFILKIPKKRLSIHYIYTYTSPNLCVHASHIFCLFVSIMNYYQLVLFMPLCYSWALIPHIWELVPYIKTNGTRWCIHWIHSNWYIFFPQISNISIFSNSVACVYVSLVFCSLFGVAVCDSPVCSPCVVCCSGTCCRGQ